MQEILILIKPVMRGKDGMAACRPECLQAGSSMNGTGMLRRHEDAEEWLRAAEMKDHPETVPAGPVRGNRYIRVRGGECRIVGMVALRRELNQELYHFGGHFGCSACPSERRRGDAVRLRRHFCSSAVGRD